MKNIAFLLLFCAGGWASANAQRQQPVRFRTDAARQQITVEVGGKPFTTYWYGDTLAKPIFFPVRTASGHTVTRGFPIAPRPGERTDHPHQAGLWFTYEDVNGLDFWNNSYAVTGERKKHLGWIRQDTIEELKGGKTGLLTVRTYWEDPEGHKLLRAETTFRISGTSTSRQIDRKTTLTALVPVTFADRKDGMLGIRVAQALELPSNPNLEAMTGNRTGKPQNEHSPANGNYLTSEGKQGDAAWGSRARWCMLYGKQAGEIESIIIFDHPQNPGYPTYWHARGYGLFAANPLAPSAFDKSAQPMNLHLDQGASVTFRFRVLILNGNAPADTARLNHIAAEFAAQ